MSVTLGIVCLAVGLFSVGVACVRPAPGRERMRLRLFVLGPVVIVVGILLLVGVI